MHSSRKKVALQHHAKHLEIFGAHSSWIMYATLALVDYYYFFRKIALMNQERNKYNPRISILFFLKKDHIS